jgi:hypothetical protein
MLTFANSDSAAVGQSVIAIGSPLGLENSVSNGIVSGLRDESGRKWIQTTAPASPGNSGGPLINLSGQVLGVLAWKVLGGENLNFAVPSNSVKSLLAFAGSSVKPLDSSGTRNFKFAAGQSVYVVGSDLQLERRAAQQFSNDHRFNVASGLSSADFVFVSLRDGMDELALVLLRDDYSQNRTNVDGLREHALWRRGGEVRRFKSEVRSLVRQFEQDVLRSPESKGNH